MLFNGAAGVRRDLHQQHILNFEFRAYAKQKRGDTLAVSVGQFGQVARAHEYFNIGARPAQLCVTFNRRCKTKVDRIEDRISNDLDLFFRRQIDGANERCQIAVRLRHQDRHALGTRDHIERHLIEAQNVVRASLRRPCQFGCIAAVNTDFEAFFDKRRDHIFKMRKRRARLATNVDYVRAFGDLFTCARDHVFNRQRGRINRFSENAQVMF